jgi:hypothetical protein
LRNGFQARQVGWRILHGRAQIVGDVPQQGASKLSLFDIRAADVELLPINIDRHRDRQDDDHAERKREDQLEQRKRAPPKRFET